MAPGQWVLSLSVNWRAVCGLLSSNDEVTPPEGLILSRGKDFLKGRGAHAQDRQCKQAHMPILVAGIKGRGIIF